MPIGERVGGRTGGTGNAVRFERFVDIAGGEGVDGEALQQRLDDGSDNPCRRVAHIDEFCRGGIKTLVEGEPLRRQVEALDDFEK